MNIRVIAFGMVFILIALFILTKLYAKTSQEKNKREALYAEIVFKHREMPEFDTQQCLLEISKALDISQENARQMLVKDGIISPI